MTVPSIQPDVPRAKMLKHPALHPYWGGYPVCFEAREQYVREYGMVLLPSEVLDTLAQALKHLRVIEVGSGSGYLASRLRHREVNIWATDLGKQDIVKYHIHSLYQLDFEGDSVEHLPGVYDVVLMSWPPYDHPFALQVANAMAPGQLLIFQGELGGCTGDDRFSEEMNSDRWRVNETLTKQLNKHHIQFWGLHDLWTAWFRNP